MSPLDRFKKDISGKSVGVVGIGISNTPIILMLAEMGIRVFAFDKRSEEQLGDSLYELKRCGVTLICGADYMDHLCGDIIIKTPGMRYDHPALCEKRQKGSVITSEIELFFQYCPAKIFAVTGSDGKTTTTSLIYEMLKQTGRKVHLGGNIGKPLFCRLSEISAEDWVVAELSSFQLHTLRKSPQVAVVTNLSPNHLDVHKDMNEYIDAKKNIFLYQDPRGILVINTDNEITSGFDKDAKGAVRYFSFQKDHQKNGAFFCNGAIWLRREGASAEKLLDRSALLLRGDHNVENFMAAVCAVYDYCSDDMIRSVAGSFGGVRHRMEFIREVNGVRFYNDSIGSSPTRTIATLKSFDQKVRLIAGGYDKKIPYEALGEEIPQRVKKLYLCGKTAKTIRKAVIAADPYFPIDEFDQLKTAIENAFRESESGDIVLLSPASASFDQFKNFEERGEFFASVVKELK